jgi:short subunit dehydrogenase-like uncharacterized protein
VTGAKREYSEESLGMILLTGATGFVGKAVVQRLLAED